MSSEYTIPGIVLTRIGHAVREFGRAHEELWNRLERMDPRPGDDLQWEVTASGWRLYGHYLPEEVLTPPDDGPR
ncbi:hypothetical protein ACLFMI_10165 [Pseudonocardia nantongensis]|uniref:hypothetical protein n=1 Tax=Pseudonocardia nantongensis TaxID=1181885 RepID=UPI00397A3BC9